MNTSSFPMFSRGSTAFRRLSGRVALTALIGALAVAGCQAGDSLAGPAWQWTGVQETNPTGEALAPDPKSYTIEFLTDGTVKIQADCNSLNGTYAVGVPLDLTIDVVTTPTACADASLDGTFLDYLGQVASYSTSRGALELSLADDAGAMHFTAPGS